MSHHLLHGEITDRILKCAVDVHRALGPRLPELTYQRAMAVCMRKQGLRFRQTPELEMLYDGVMAVIGQTLSSKRQSSWSLRPSRQ